MFSLVVEVDNDKVKQNQAAKAAKQLNVKRGQHFVELDEEEYLSVGLGEEEGEIASPNMDRHKPRRNMRAREHHKRASARG